jgi:hypothetical protein
VVSGSRKSNWEVWGFVEQEGKWEVGIFGSVKASWRKMSEECRKMDMEGAGRIAFRIAF